MQSGTAAGACASGFGVCCTFSIACGATSSVSQVFSLRIKSLALWKVFSFIFVIDIWFFYTMTNLDAKRKCLQKSKPRIKMLQSKKAIFNWSNCFGDFIKSFKKLTKTINNPFDSTVNLIEYFLWPNLTVLPCKPR